VAAVVNRVDTALAVFAILKKRLRADVVLLTGRMRPLDRDDVLATYGRRVKANARTRTPDERKLVVVGTPCIEADADFDVDAMVTESASFDSLRQRFGRVDRLGGYKGEDGEGKAEAVIVHDKDEKRDPIYGDTITETMKWLDGRLDKKQKTVDFGSRSLLDAPSTLFAPNEMAPTLLPAYLDLWSQTSPQPFAVPEAALFLHGPRSGPEDVQVVWRADLDEAALALRDVRRRHGAR
jgi:CRISPR-associated endonuclease/helicase Cas3